METFLPVFKEQNPQLITDAYIRRGQHPFLYAEYRKFTIPLSCNWLASASLDRYAAAPPVAGNSKSRIVGVKNEDMEEILRQAQLLRSCHGRPTSQKVRWRHLQNPEQRSVQGMWKPGLFEKVHVQPDP